MKNYLKTTLIVVLIAFSSASFGQMKRSLIPGDIYKIKSISDANISPEGNWVVYTLTTVDSAKDKRNSDIWMASWDGQETIQLTHTATQGESNPKWSPDGKYLSFTSSREGTKSQVWLMNRKGGEAFKLTDLKGELSDYEWHPKGHQLLLTIKEPADTSKVKTRKPYVINKYKFKQDYVGYIHESRYTHLYILDIETKKLDTLTRGEYNVSQAKWSPDGSKIAFVSNRSEDHEKNSNTDIWLIDTKKGSLPVQFTTWKGSDHSPSWSPDGKSLAYLRSTSDENYIMYDQSILCVAEISNGTPKLLSKNLDRPVSSPKWNKDGKEIIVLIADDCQRYVGSYSVANETLNKIAGGNRSFNSIEPHPNSGWLFGMSESHLPQEYYIQEGADLRRLTYVHQPFFDEIKLAKVEKITSKSKDGTLVSSLLFLPAEAPSGKLPLIVFIHGGPVSQDDFGFDLTRQMLAASGYAVAAVNYRGSNGRGIAYCKAIYADWGNKEVMDLLGAVDHLVAKGIADPKNLAIGGWSYGGILTNYTIAKDNRFKAAISGAGSSLQLSLYGVDQYILQLDNELGQPWKNNNYEKYLKISYPFLKADKIKTPTMFVTGEKDFNVPAIGSEQMYQALKSQDIPTELIIYPGQFHGISQPSFMKDRYERYIQWYDKYMKKPFIADKAMP
jgi:dipeptidyl aminopeptidase/acylaminoacyl peptidase